jgi:8-amino-7-oxononanoate synthase
MLDGSMVANFASNDYLGLAAHPELIDSVRTSILRFGFGSGASRLLAGGASPHRDLEERISGFKETEAAILFNSGYAANTGAIPALAAAGDTIFSDALNHASIIDGCRLSRAKTVIYRHRDMNHLEDLLREERSGSRRLVVSDSVFSMDGDIAPLPEITALCERFGALLYIDDAHATGVLGCGRGSLAEFDISPQPWIIQMGTFSKALGSSGGFVAGSGSVIEWIMNRARSFIFSTALPACAAAASLTAIGLLERSPELLARLWSNRRKVAEGLRENGLATQSLTPIIPVLMEDSQAAAAIASRLRERGLYVPAIRPPTVETPRLRLVVSAAHTAEDIELAVRSLGELLKPD